MSGFTPGPWLLKDSPNAASGAILVRDYARSHVQYVPLADAHLIAAAPEMFEALEYAVSCLVSARKNYEEDLGLWQDVNKAISGGNQALAKARGDTPMNEERT